MDLIGLILLVLAGAVALLTKRLDWSVALLAAGLICQYTAVSGQLIHR